MRVALSQRLSETVDRLVAQFIAEESNEHAASLAKQVSALPLVQDMGGFCGLRASGELVEVNWDEPESVREISDQRVANMALYQGAKRFADLTELSPRRTDSAVTCATCGGSGLAQVPEHLQQGVLCWCGGLGWLPSIDHELEAMQPVAAIKRWWQFWRVG